MQIKYIKNISDIKSLADTVFINYYKNDSDYKYDTKEEKFVNIKIALKEDSSKISERSFIRLLKKSIMDTKKANIGKAVLDLKKLLEISEDCVDVANKDKFIQNITSYILIAGYKFDKYKTEKTNKLKEIYIVADFDKNIMDLLRSGEIYGESTNISRDLSNTPGNDMTPSILANFAENLFKKEIKDKDSKLKINILSEKECKKLGMNLFCAVSQGSSEESKLIVIEYMNGKKDEKPIVFVGKGITFDTGGLNVKTQKMEDMIMDMTGGGAVISAMRGIVDLKIKKNIIAIVPAVENALSGSSYRPGDIIKSMSGITVEIGNTDAEGRLILADAITFSEKYNPRIIIDVATLTGAAIISLGEKASGLVSFDKDLKQKVLDLSEENHEYMYPLPAWEEYRDDIKSNVADIININNKKASGGGSITAGMFIYEFVNKLNMDRRNIKIKDNISWAHIDIAPRMTSNYQDNLESGAVGEPVKTLIDIAIKL